MQDGVPQFYFIANRRRRQAEVRRLYLCRLFNHRREYGEGNNLGTLSNRLDVISLINNPPMMFNGLLTIAGKDTALITQLNTFDLDTLPNYQPQNRDMVKMMWVYQEMEAIH